MLSVKYWCDGSFGIAILKLILKHILKKLVTEIVCEAGSPELLALSSLVSGLLALKTHRLLKVTR